MRCPERSLQLQNMGYQKQETSEKEHSEQHVCHFSAANTFDYELGKMYEWYRLMVQSLEVHIHNNPMEKKRYACLRTTKRRDFFLLSMKTS